MVHILQMKQNHGMKDQTLDKQLAHSVVFLLMRCLCRLLTILISF